MELKKNPKADLEKRKGIYVELGLILALATCLVAFNVKSYDHEEIEVSDRTVIDEVEEVVLQTQVEETPPPPEPEAPEVITEVHVIDNDQESDNEIGIISMDLTDDIELGDAIVAAPDEEVEVKEEQIYVVVEEVAQFPGGEEALYKFLKENLVYPQIARQTGIEGKVYIRFVVEKDGSISNVRVMRDIGGGCGEEAMRVVKTMPKWKPAKQQTRTVRSEFNLPVNFSFN